nr:DNA mismatch repair endonuclease MutL [Petrachloros mirabilis]
MVRLVSMSRQIHPIGRDLVHHIAAGEVIDSLAAVVRELVDNALDAQATRVTLGLWPDQWRVQVSDNGHGLSGLNLQQAAMAHSTSKLSSTMALQRITTLGFRGEALHSLAQLGTLSICSRCPEENSGWQATYQSDGQVQAITPIAIAPGTVVTVDQVFARYPQRRQMMPSLTQQMRAIQGIIHDQALCHPEVTWRVQRQDRLWFSISPGRTALTIFPQLLATVQPGDLRHIHQDLRPLLPGTIEVVIGLPDRCHRGRPDWLRVAVNGRCVQVSGADPSRNGQLRPFEQTIITAFRQTLPRHRYPLCFVHIHAEPSQVDWNRHPAKTSIYLNHLAPWQDALAAAIRTLLQVQPEVGDRTHAQHLARWVKATEQAGIYGLGRGDAIASPLSDPLSDPLPTPESSSPKLPLRAIAQLHQTYILAEHPTGLWLVEQHIAHERVLYEKLCLDWEIQTLETPILLPTLTEAQVKQLQHLGLTLEPFGTQDWIARSAPALLSNREDCVAALLELSRGNGLQPALVATACRSALRNGTPLSLPEMQALLDQWQATNHPRTCPHGRPIYFTLEEHQLARFFRRHWVIGKSHGL